MSDANASIAFNIVVYGDILPGQTNWFTDYLIPMLFGDVTSGQQHQLIGRRTQYNNWVRYFFKGKYLLRGGQSIFAVKDNKFIVPDSTLLSWIGIDKLPYYLLFLRSHVRVLMNPLTILTSRRNANELAKWAYSLCREGITNIDVQLSEGISRLAFIERADINTEYYKGQYTPSGVMLTQQQLRRKQFKRTSRESDDDENDDGRSVRQRLLTLSDRVNESITAILPENPHVRSAPIMTSDGRYIHGSDLIDDPSLCPGLLSDDISPQSSSDDDEEDDPIVPNSTDVSVPVFSPLSRGEDESLLSVVGPSSSSSSPPPPENVQLRDDSDTEVDVVNQASPSSGPLISPLASYYRPSPSQKPTRSSRSPTRSPIAVVPCVVVPFGTAPSPPVATSPASPSSAAVLLPAPKEERVRCELETINEWFKSPTTMDGYILTSYVDLENFLNTKGELGDKVASAVSSMLSIYQLHRDIFERPAYWYELRRYFGESRETPTTTEVVWAMIPKLYAIYKLRKFNRRFNMSDALLNDIYRCVSRDSVKEFLDIAFLPTNTLFVVNINVLICRYNNWKSLPSYFPSFSVLIGRLMELYSGLNYDPDAEEITGLPYVDATRMVRIVIRRKFEIKRVLFADVSNLCEEWRHQLTTDYRVSDGSVSLNEKSTEYADLLSHSLSAWDGPVYKNLSIKFTK